MVNKDWRPFAYGGLASIAAEFGNVFFLQLFYVILLLLYMNTLIFSMQMCQELYFPSVKGKNSYFLLKSKFFNFPIIAFM